MSAAEVELVNELADGADVSLDRSGGATPRSAAGKLGDLAADAGLRRLQILAWRDLDDPEAGGSELHAARIAERWAEAGLDVTMQTSRAAGHPARGWRDGYRLERRSGRYGIFPAAALRGVLGAAKPDGMVEIWNGMPFFSPIWARVPTVVFLHHVHGSMWHQVLPPRLARVGEAVEQRIAPPFYRQTPVVTLSSSSRRTILDTMGFHPDRVTVVPPGIDDRFGPGGLRSPTPLVAAVGRLVPYKGFPTLVDILGRLRQRHPDLQAVIGGEGYARPEIEAAVAAAGATSWLHLPGHLDDDALVDLYRRAWVVTSTSSHEGWGMTITEAAACRTPSVVTRIPGHADAVLDGRTGLLADDPADLEAGLDRVLRDHQLRRQFGEAAWLRAQELTWDTTARRTLEALAHEARRRRPAPGVRLLGDPI